MFDYFAYGLGITANFAISEFTAIARQENPDVRIILDRNFADESVVIEDTTQLTIKAARTMSYVFDRSVGAFYIYHGNRIVVVPSPSATIEQVRIYLVGTIMALLLYQRGMLVLHASSVAMNGKAVVFLGKSGSGKSSIAAALCQRGYGLISDDVVAVDLGSSSPIVHPGFGQYKLSEAAARALGLENSSSIVRDMQQRGYISCQKFSIQSLPLDRAYLLLPDGEPEIAKIKPRATVPKLLVHMVPTIWNLSQTPEHFFQSSKLAQTVPFYTLSRGAKIETLPKLADLVESRVMRRATAPISVSEDAA